MNDASWTDPLYPRHGGYRNLRSFQIAQLVYDVTVRFCGRYVSRRSRTYDQMVQAARSGVQNIAEGSQTSGTSRKSEMRLTDVARASLEELRLDYEDFLRHRKLELWRKGDPRRQSLINARPTTADDVARWVVQVGKHGFVNAARTGAGAGTAAVAGVHGRLGGRTEIGATLGPTSDRTKSGARPDSSTNSAESMMSTTSTRTPLPGTGTTATSTGTAATSTGTAVAPTAKPNYRELSANAALTLIAVASSLLDRQLAALARVFTEEGGFSERLYRARRTQRCGPPRRE